MLEHICKYASLLKTNNKREHRKSILDPPSGNNCIKTELGSYSFKRTSLEVNDIESLARVQLHQNKNRSPLQGTCKHHKNPGRVVESQTTKIPKLEHPYQMLGYQLENNYQPNNSNQSPSNN